ncbi:MAG: TRAP transporter substrate-binding protein DctP [Deltaproteobacteria bacterium]|nr:TRAP transporter substrate-binding protein DctP [Deltaproteobacteria bacterium]NND28921.1 TRAP transporter substrate-binding protein DctP [Myxococcales bacterium]MBT8464064.1 TRAP transporter substrate-binding protein DctP [Deltaproteobacteria bacterium]MBT8483340.1 TRAP transporter substrate-binding protein DctP [Deltaproteobacteria bacterium]NNK05925.1 TRAP transporter substrate-binding protein DctP [Myxococcales bacterium]
MWKRSFAIAFAIAAMFLPGSNVPRAAANGPLVIRYASLAPPSSAFGKVLKAWGRQFKKETEGRAELRFYTGGSQGDERDFIRKIRAGQIDAAGITTTGMGMIVRPILVLTAPGLITEMDQLVHVRGALRGRFEEMFRSAGFELLTWGDGGKNRLFSAQPFARPSDLKAGRPWAWKDDPVFAGYLGVIGANPVRVGANEVYGGLQTRMIDTVPSSCIMAVAIQWYTKLNYMAEQNFNILIGGSIIKKEVFDQLLPGDRKILLDTAERGARAIDKFVLRDDENAYRTLVERGIRVVDLSPHQAEWDAVAEQARQQLAGRVYSKSLLAEVTRLASEK